MDPNQNYNTPMEEEEGLDIVALLKDLWKGRKTIIIVTCLFIALGLVAALTMKRTYTVNTIMVPQMNSRSSSSLSSLASLAGFDIGTLHYAKADTAVCMLTYAKEYAKPSVMSYVLKYTIGLPGVIMGAIRKDKPEEEALPAEEEEGDAPKPLVLTKEEAKLMKAIAANVSLAVDKKEGYITLTVNGSEPLQTAELALKAQQLLQEEVTRFRTEKAQAQLNYVQARYNEIKAEAEAYQSQLAVVRDRSQQMATTRSKIEQERIQNKYNVANSIYGEMA